MPDTTFDLLARKELERKLKAQNSRKGKNRKLHPVRSEAELKQHILNNVVCKTSGCWEWALSLNETGYGQCSNFGGELRAHRLSWVLFEGAIPEGLDVCHHCDNPKCVRPDHLFVGTAKDNIQDASRKGKFVSRRATQGFLCPSVVREIRNSEEPSLVLAKKYKVSLCSIKEARTYRSWKHVE